MSVYDNSLSEYLEGLTRGDASASEAGSTTGGAGACAVVASNAAALIGLAANTILNGLDDGDADNPWRENAAQVVVGAAKAVSDLKALTAVDARTLEELEAARRIEAEASQQNGLVDKAVQASTTVALEVCKVCLDILKLAARLVDSKDRTVQTRVGTAALVADASLKSALLTVDTHLAFIKDKIYRSTLALERNRILGEDENLRDQILSHVRESLSETPAPTPQNAPTSAA